MGLLEFLEWCEDMNAEPVLAVYAGYSLKGRIHVNPGADLEPFVQEALEEIEYVIGDTNTKWGARRAKDGHPAPFKLRYVEIGNEDWFDKSRQLRWPLRAISRRDQSQAIRQLKSISSVGSEQPAEKRVHSRKPDMIDEHYYRSTDEFLRRCRRTTTKYDRNGPEIFVGEWAAHEDGRFTPWDDRSKKSHPRRP